MAGGGLIQLVSIGAQDVYLVGNPQITFFKVTYQRHTNFARECIKQDMTGGSAWGKTGVCTISRSGDLIGPMHVEILLPALSAGLASPAKVANSTSTSALALQTTFNWCWVNYVGFRILQQVTIEIGGQPIDRHYSTWYYMWFELSTPASKREGLQRMVGGYDITEVPLGLTTNALQAQTLYVPLVFWFNTHPGLALPLIALQYHEVKLSVTVAPHTDCTVLLSEGTVFSQVLDLEWGVAPLTPAPPGLEVDVWADYYYLDSDERKRFATQPHEYLIKQLQYIDQSGISSASRSRGNISYGTLNHPVSFHVWGFRKSVTEASPDWTNFTNSPPFLQFLGKSIVAEHNLTLNGNDRYSSKKVEYYNLVQPYNHFTAIPPTGLLTYSYALQPIEHQPSGTLNFSRIDNAFNKFTCIPDGELNGLLGPTSVLANAAWRGTNYDAHIFSVNYNVLRIMSGMGGLAYSN